MESPLAIASATQDVGPPPIHRETEHHVRDSQTLGLVQ